MEPGGYDELMAHLRRDRFWGRVVIDVQDGREILLRLERTFKSPREALRVLTTKERDAVPA